VGLISSVVILIKNFAILPPSNLLLSLIAGAIYMSASIWYFKALKLEEASRISPLTSLSGVFILIWAYLFLGEILTPVKYFGVFLLVSGAFLISIKRDFKLRNKKAFWLIVVATATATLYTTLTKYLLKFADYSIVFAYTNIGYFVSTIPLIYIYMAEIKKLSQMYGKRLLTPIATSRMINIVGLFSFTVAISYSQQVSLVVGMFKIQPLFVLIFASIISIFYPKILKEEIKGSIIALKFIAVIMTIIGALLIA